MTNELARRFDHAQDVTRTPAAAQAVRIERSLAAGNRRVAEAMATLDPGLGAGVLEVRGGLAIFAGTGSPLTQALAMGLGGQVEPADLDRLEAFLARGGASVQLELCPFADPSLCRLLAGRGYRIHEWQQTWIRPLADDDAADAPVERVDVRRPAPGEEDTVLRTVMSAFLEGEGVSDEELRLLRPAAFAANQELLGAWVDGTLAGGGTLAHDDGVAHLVGTAVLPAFRGRGVQSALIRHRLTRARQLGCTLAASTTAPGSASHRNMERRGFSAAYPKVVMLREVSARSER